MKKTDKILVTGTSGFIGSHILRVLYQRGYRNLVANSASRDLRKDFDNWKEWKNDPSIIEKWMIEDTVDK